MTALSKSHCDSQLRFREFAETSLAPFASSFDRQEQLPRQVIDSLGRNGYLGAIVPCGHGGGGMDMLEFGLLNLELGRVCSSTRSLLTVHSMVCNAISRWGRPAHKERWLSKLAKGVAIGAFCLSEPDVGSDAASIQTTAVARNGHYVLNGTKKWISFGQIADLFLVFAKVAGKVSALLVERSSPGLTLQPINGMLGVRASMLASLNFNDCRVSKSNLLGGLGFGLSTIANSALDIGRYSVAWGCVGIAEACLEASVNYASRRRQFGVLLKDHQLIRRMVTDMITSVEAARLLCIQAGVSKGLGSPDTLIQTCIAKYFASTTCTRVAADALQIHGALGCSDESSVARYFRDAQIMEIIEGSTQIQQLIIAGDAFAAGHSEPQAGADTRGERADTKSN